MSLMQDQIEALRQAIEQAERMVPSDYPNSHQQEPVAFRNTETGDFCTGGFLRKDWAKWQPLYAAPARPVVHAVRCTYPQCQATNGCVGACSKGQAEKQKPVAFVSGYTNGECVVMPMNPAVVFSVGTALYNAPVHASDISQERVDETAKREHKFAEMVEKGTKAWDGVPDDWVDDLRGGAEKQEFECPRCGHCCQQKEWVGLDDDIPGLGLVTEEFYNGMLCAEDILRKKNT